MSWADMVKGRTTAAEEPEPAAAPAKASEPDADLASKESADAPTIEPAASEEVTRGPSSNGPSVEVSETSSELRGDMASSPEESDDVNDEDSAELMDALSRGESEPRPEVDLMSSPLESPAESRSATPRVSLRSSSEDGRSATPEKKTEPPPTPPEAETKPVMQLKAKPKGLLARIQPRNKSGEEKSTVVEADSAQGESAQDEEHEGNSKTASRVSLDSSDAGTTGRKKYTPEFLLAYRTHSSCQALPSEHNIPMQLLVQKGDFAGDDSNWRDGKRPKKYTPEFLL